MIPILIAAAAAKVVPSAAATLLPPGAAPNAQAGIPPVVPQAAPTTWFMQHAAWFTHGMAGLFIVAAVALIILLALQTTKQEGLTGSIGGRVESAYRGRLGAEEQLKRWTGVAAVSFVVSAFLLSLTGI
ncbi:MAG TPA: preprotein translocase subunit SecG [Candidatus Dormibacteraeota bacterium]|jgi:preprotein translocase subunit SecG|nr:preprotein translocase subunit SecG [Candidatus Dormibacteraeota bacterium]